KVLSGPGEYEINDVFITGVGTYDKRRIKNTVYVLELEGMVICHLGTLGHIPTADQLEQLSNIDVLLVPVGGGNTLNATEASEVISTIEPHIVIPMHFRVDDFDADLDGLEPFAKEMGIGEVAPQE